MLGGNELVGAEIAAILIFEVATLAPDRRVEIDLSGTT
jgi:hypothetical protein